jgi:HSP20 family protein
MKHRLTETSESPVIFKLLPEDHFFHVMADIDRLIRRRAYALFSARGSTHGHDLDDWLQAESEILEFAPLEVSQTEDAITATAKLPGYHAKDIEIHVEPQRLFVSGQREQTPDSKNRKASRSRQYPNFLFCALDLPAVIDAGKVTATLSHGQLRIELPKQETAKPGPLAATAAA